MFTQEYGTSTAITISLNSLANNASRESTAVDNTSDKWLDALCQVSIAVGTVAAPRVVYVYVYGSEDGTAYSDPATGSDAGITLEDPTVMKLAQVISVPSSTKTYEGQPFSIASAFGGIMPRKWGIVVNNQSGAALSASGNSAKYSGITVDPG